jgi:uncharacterized protein (TIGR03435 family)
MIDRIADKLDFGSILLLAAIGIGFVSAPQTRAQSPAQPQVGAPAPLEFEVASIKPRPVAPGAMMVTFRHGTLNVDIARLRQIIGLAYAIQRVRVQGGPSWLDTEQYVIAAKAGSADASWDQARTMLQTLLADRFKLAVHRETKELDVYSLVVGKNGSKLQAAKEDEKTDTTQVRTQSGLQMTFQKMPIVGLVNTVANILGSPVLDKTELKGFYDFKLEWTPDGSQFRKPGNDGLAQSVDSAPDLIGALQEQLGLKMEKKKGPGEVLVVDHAEKASEN